MQDWLTPKSRNSSRIMNGYSSAASMPRLALGACHDATRTYPGTGRPAVQHERRPAANPRTSCGSGLAEANASGETDRLVGRTAPAGVPVRRGIKGFAASFGPRHRGLAATGRGLDRARPDCPIAPGPSPTPAVPCGLETRTTSISLPLKQFVHLYGHTVPSVTAYIIDIGTRHSLFLRHVDFGRPAVRRLSGVDEITQGGIRRSYSLGHGTHVAANLSAAQVMVWQGVTLVAVPLGARAVACSVRTRSRPRSRRGAKAAMCGRELAGQTPCGPAYRNAQPAAVRPDQAVRLTEAFASLSGNRRCSGVGLLAAAHLNCGPTRSRIRPCGVVGQAPMKPTPCWRRQIAFMIPPRTGYVILAVSNLASRFRNCCADGHVHRRGYPVADGDQAADICTARGCAPQCVPAHQRRTVAARVSSPTSVRKARSADQRHCVAPAAHGLRVTALRRADARTIGGPFRMRHRHCT